MTLFELMNNTQFFNKTTTILNRKKTLKGVKLIIKTKKLTCLNNKKLV